MIVGCSLTKRPIAPANAIISATEMMTAAIITAISSTMPTAVMIESSENTRSMTMICRITAAKPALTAAAASPSAPSSDWWISTVLFQIRNRPPPIRIRSRPEISWLTNVEREQRLRQADDPGQDQQQADPHEHRQEQADHARLPLLLGRQLVDQDRDEDDVVDAQHQLERGQRQEGDPGLRVGQEFEHRGGGGRRCGGSRTEAVRGILAALRRIGRTPGRAVRSLPPGRRRRRSWPRSCCGPARRPRPAPSRGNAANAARKLAFM